MIQFGSMAVRNALGAILGIFVLANSSHGQGGATLAGTRLWVVCRYDQSGIQAINRREIADFNNQDDADRYASKLMSARPGATTSYFFISERRGQGAGQGGGQTWTPVPGARPPVVAAPRETQDRALAAYTKELQEESVFLKRTLAKLNAETLEAKQRYSRLLKMRSEARERLVDFAQELYALDKFRCSDGNSWGGCSSHPAQKLRFLENREDAVRDAERSGDNLIRDEILAAKRRVEKLDVDMRSLNDRTRHFNKCLEHHRELVRRSEAGEVWLALNATPPRYVPRNLTFSPSH